MTVLGIEQILHNFEDQKFANFYNLELVHFRVTLVILASNFLWRKRLKRNVTVILDQCLKPEMVFALMTLMFDKDT